MKLQHVPALLQADRMYTVGVALPRDGDFSDKAYTYKVPKSVKLKVGDLVVVPACDRVVVGEVRGIHATPNIDLDLSVTYRWIIQRVDTRVYDRLTSEDAETTRLMELEEEADDDMGETERLAAVQAFAVAYPATAQRLAATTDRAKKPARKKAARRKK